MLMETNPIEEKLKKQFPDLHFYVHKHYRADETFIYVVNYDTDATEDEVEQIKGACERMEITFRLERIPF